MYVHFYVIDLEVNKFLSKLCTVEIIEKNEKQHK